MGIGLLDSSAVVAYLYADDALHHDAVEAIESAVRAGDSLAISAVGWAELLGGVHQGHQEQQVARALISDFGIAIVSVDALGCENPVFKGSFGVRPRSTEPKVTGSNPLGRDHESPAKR